MQIGFQKYPFTTVGTMGIKWLDTLGNLFGFKDAGGKPRVSSTPYYVDIADGNIANHIPWTKDGYNGALSASAEDLWAVGGQYVFPTVAQQMEIVSDSTDDDGSPVGTGARTVEIYYLDSTFTEKSEIITLNGTNAVATTATDIYRINSFRVKTVGSTGSNVGTIDIRNLADTPIYSRILPTINRSYNCVYTVPKDKILFIFNVLLSAGGSVANRPVRFITKATWDRSSGIAIPFFMSYTNVIITDGSVDVPIECPTRFPAGVDIKVSAISPDGATYGAVTLRGWLENV